MKTYLVTHNWSNDGRPSAYIVQSVRHPSETEVITLCDIDFDPEFESIDIEEMTVHKLDQHGWVSMKDKMPPADCKVLLSHESNDYRTFFGYYSTQFGEVVSSKDGASMMHMTHWMNIPLNTPENRI